MQLSALPQVRELAALMQAHGVTRCVLCPGSRNSPIVRTLDALPGFSCRSVTDERSAGFIALGWAAADRAPVAVCVTSGSALLNLHPAVAEAYYRHVPLLIVSADRPCAWIDQQDGQTLPQPGVFGNLTPCSVQLPGSMQDSTGDAAWHTNRLINQALLSLCEYGGIPAHINIPLSEPLFEDTSAALPPVRVIRRLDLAHPRGAATLAALVGTSPRRLLLLGQLPDRPDWAAWLAAAGWAVVGEHLSNAHGIAQTRPDLVLGASPDSTLSPDLLLTCGGCLISKRLKQLLRLTPPRLHLHLSPDGAIIDTFRCLTHCLRGTPEQLLQALHCNSSDSTSCVPDSSDHPYAARWLLPPGDATPAPAPSPVQDPLPWSGIRAVGELMDRLVPGDTLHLANSSAVRYAQLFPLPSGVHVECNRGVNGIEGCLSSAVGYAQSTSGLQYLIIGDLAFFYDMNALALDGIGPNLRILLLNNHTGGIFSTLPGRPCAMVAGKSTATAEGWAQACGFCYRAVHDADGWAQALALLTSDKPAGPVLVELFLSAETDATAWTTRL